MKIAYIGLIVLDQRTKEETDFHVTLEYFKNVSQSERETVARSFLDDIGNGEIWCGIDKIGISLDNKLSAVEVQLPNNLIKYFKGIIPHCTISAREPYKPKDSYKCLNGEIESTVADSTGIMFCRAAAFGYDNKPIKF